MGADQFPGKRKLVMSPFVPAVDFSQMIRAKVFLQHKVALILFIPQNCINHALMPDAAVFRWNPQLVQFSADRVFAHARQPKMKDHFYNGCLLRNDLDFSVIEFQTVHLRSGGNALLEFLSNPPGAVFRNRAAFLLRIRSKDGQHQLAIPAHGVNILFLEENVDPQRLQLAHGFQQRDRIPGKAADAFRQHQIYFIRLFDTM